jgi:K+-sensing histidine kinase KdpD
MIHLKYFFRNVYIASILGVAVILYILKDLQLIFGYTPQLLLFLVVIAFAAWCGGLLAGLFTTLVSAVASVYFLFEPYNFLAVASPGGLLHVALLVSVGAICSLIISLLYKQQQRALHTVMEREEQLKQEIAERNKTRAERDLYVFLAKSSTEFIGMCDTEGAPFLSTMPACVS